MLNGYWGGGGGGGKRKPPRLGRTGKIWNLSSGTILVLINNSREITCLIKFVF